jgi:signal transduction histidine kinase
MAVFSVSWVFFLLIATKLGKYDKKGFLVLVTTIPVIFILGVYTFFPGKEVYIFPLFYWSIYVYLKQEKGELFRDPIFIAYVVLSFLSLIDLFAVKGIIRYILPFSVLLLLFRKYTSLTGMAIWGFFLILLTFTWFVNKDLFLLLNTFFPLYLSYEYLSMYRKLIERDKQIYRNIFDSAVNTELQRYFDEIKDQLSVAYKRLREIFKLSNKTLKPINIEEILEKVVEGLLDLGYTGVLVAVDYKNTHIYRKGGFFPNVNFFVKNKFPDTNEIEISEDEKFVHLPLFSDEGKIGVLSVYKKDKISSSEIEYLRTYANSVAISIAKTLYFKELGLLENIMSRMFEAIDIGIVVLNRAFYIESANKAVENIFNRKPEGYFFKVFPELSTLEQKLKKVLEEKKSIDITISPMEEKGKTYRIKIVPVLLDKEHEKIVVLIEDITEKVKLEAQLIETEKHAVVGKLAAGLSHDIRNPLTTVKAAAFSIKKVAEKNKQEKIKKLAESIEKNSDRAEKIIEKLLNYAKPSYYKKKPVNVKDIIENSLEVAVPSNIKKSIKLKTNLEDAYVFADPSSLQQVFVNIIMNAAEAIDGEGEIYIENRINGEYIEVIIRDTGGGIPEEIIKDIFEPFFTTKEKGTGLGLSVVNKIIKDHNGYINVRSEEGKGTEFTINLPAYKGEEENNDRE